MPEKIDWRGAGAVFAFAFALGLWVYAPGWRAGLFPIDDAIVLSTLPNAGGIGHFIASIFGVQPRPVFLPLTDLVTALPMGSWTGIRLLNLALQSISAALVYLLLGASRRSRLLAMVMALIFALHPLHTFPVLWIASVKDVLVCTLMLACVFAYTRGRRIWAVFALVAALLAKQSAYGLLLWFPVYEFSRGVPWRKCLRRVVPIFLACVAVMGLSLWRSFHVQKLVFVFDQTLGIFGTYATKILWPFPVALYYPMPGLASAAWALAILLLIYVVWRREFLAPAALLAAFMGPYLFMVPNHLLITNGYAYGIVAPVVLWLGAVALKANPASRNARNYLLPLGCMLLVYLALDWNSARAWTQPIELLRENARLYPGDAGIRNRLALFLEHENPLEAWDLFARSLQQSSERGEFSNTAFEGMTAIAMASLDEDKIRFLDTWSARQAQGRGCEYLAEIFAEKGRAMLPDLRECSQAFAARMAKSYSDVTNEALQINLGKLALERRQVDQAQTAFDRAVSVALQQKRAVSNDAFDGLVRIAVLKRDFVRLQKLERLASGQKQDFCPLLSGHLRRTGVIAEYQPRYCAQEFSH